ncbi:MAG: hypothetical protein KC656_07210, partial [Myxococcales bacterium]|nr:hypothetical protein [Myxococcales bacterium]
HLLVDHRFSNWADPDDGLDTVVPHELFHGIQAAYSPDWPVWFSEGTATWAERQYIDDSFDFMGFAGAYLDDVSRPIDRPPAGPVPSFAYGACLFFDFLTLRHDATLMTEILELGSIDVLADPDADLMATIDAALQARSDTLEAAWVDFARWNLAVGNRAGGVESYPYAERLGAPQPEERGAFLDVDPRYFAYGTIYLRLAHEGGPMALWAEDDGSAVHLDLYPADGTEDIQPSVWTGTLDAGTQELGDLPAGTYFLLGTVPTRVDQSINVRLCLGASADVAGCAEEPEPTDEDGGGCGCRTSPSGLGWAVPIGLLGLVSRRR